MLFNTGPFFLFFLPITLLVYFLTAPRTPRGGLAWLSCASLAFYAWWDWHFISLLLASILWNYSIGLKVDTLYRTGARRSSKNFMILGVTLNLVVLGFFKYFNFFLDTVQLIGLELSPGLQIILPLGISFFTFTQIAFLVDASQGKVESRDPVSYILFVTYFPHLIAGPILHHTPMLRQFRDSILRLPRWENFAIGFFWFFMGLVKKVLLADGIQSYVTLAYTGDLTTIGFSRAWQGALAYTFQLYFDFSGYCDMAIGISLMLGVALPLNFNSPYKALNIIDFWRRWHISLSSFLRDYLYIPLGGNRNGTFRRYVNVFVTMLLGGLWHGAGWTFILWGGLHGVYLIINHGWRHVVEHTVPGLHKRFVMVGGLITFLAVVVAWVPFRAATIQDAGYMLKAMAGLNGVTLPEGFGYDWFRTLAASTGVTFTEAFPYDTGGWPFFSWLVLCLAVVFLFPNSNQLGDQFAAWLGRFQNARRRSIAALLTGALLVLCFFLIIVSTGKDFSEFLYFNF
jgi:D-alanyl-lipoteichoic acid acyltransferase DltB (MBOAT superfamily)